MTSTFEMLRRHSGAAWEDLVQNRFVAAMAGGNLPLEHFRFYIQQNLHYLPSYARMLGLAVARADSMEHLDRFQRALNQIVAVEIPANERLLARVIDLGGSGDEAPGPEPACVDYSSFLIATAATGSSNDVIVAMMPCAWSYADIGGRYHSPADHPVYQEWLGVFGGADYREYIGRLVSEADALLGEPTDAELERYRRLFATGVRCEYQFWTMALANEEES